MCIVLALFGLKAKGTGSAAALFIIMMASNLRKIKCMRHNAELSCQLLGGQSSSSLCQFLQPFPSWPVFSEHFPFTPRATRCRFATSLKCNIGRPRGLDPAHSSHQNAKLRSFDGFGSSSDSMDACKFWWILYLSSQQ